MRTLLLTLTTCLCALPVNAKYSGGTGEPNDPYQIATAADLIALGETPEDYGKHFILTADIDLDPNLPGGRLFDRAVIAPDTDPNDEWDYFHGTPFTGVFDGSSHTISHLTTTGGSYLGLFGQLGRGAEVRDLGVVDVNIAGSGHCVGGLVACNSGGSVIGSYSTGEVSGNGRVGGLVGLNETQSGFAYIYYVARIRGCYSTTSVKGEAAVGGLVGCNEGGDVIWSYTGGVVTGHESVGGLVGDDSSTPGTMGGIPPSITECCSAASVTGNTLVGGLVGSNGFGGPVTSCYSTGAVAGDSIVGGLMGSNAFGGPVTGCYSTGAVAGDSIVGGLMGFNGEWWEDPVTQCFWDIEASGQATSDGGGAGKTTTEMQTAKTFLDARWDFVGETANGTEDIWWIDEGKDYPRLWWEHIP